MIIGTYHLPWQIIGIDHHKTNLGTFETCAVRSYWVVDLESGFRWNTTNIVTYFARVCSRNLVLSDDVDSSITQKKNKSKKSDLLFHLDLTFFKYLYIVSFFAGKSKLVAFYYFLLQ